MMTPEFEATLTKLGITKKAFATTSNRLDTILCDIDRYIEAATGELASLKEEGLTRDEETQLSRALLRMRNSAIVEKLDLL